MAVSVGVAQPGVLSGIGVASPGKISGVSNGGGGSVTGVGADYGLQGYGGIGNMSQPGTISTGLAKVQSSVDQNAAALKASQDQYSNLLASLRPVSPAKVDFTAINAQARQQAEEAVNPRYTKALNDMLAQLAVQRSRAQQDYNLNVQGLQDAQTQQLEGNAIDRQRATENADTNTQQVNTQENQYQTGSGQQFADQQLQQAGQLAASGLTNSGIGRQQVQRAIDTRNMTEDQKSQDFQAQRTSEAVLKARTFEDLARSDVLTGQKTDKGTAAAKLDLDRLIEDAGFKEQDNRYNIENQRMADVASQAKGYSQLGFNNYLQSIRDPRVLAATAQAYGGLF